MTIQYSADEIGTLKCVFAHYKGTMLRMVFNSPAFWFLNVAHGAILIGDRYSESYKLPPMTWGAFHDVLGPTVAFFLIFYTGRAYERLNSFFAQVPAVALSSRIARSRLPSPSLYTSFRHRRGVPDHWYRGIMPELGSNGA